MDSISALIEKTALTDSQRGFNQTIMYGRDSSMAAVLAAARRFPMMSDRQLVFVREAQDLGELGREDGRKAMEAYAKNPVPSTILVISWKNKPFDGRTTLAKTLDAQGALIECKKVADWKLGEWVTNYAKDIKLNLSTEAGHMLAEYIGNDLGRMAGEIDKLRINLKDSGTKVTPELVQQYIGISRDYNIFELQKALSARDVLKANQIVSHFAKDPKSNPLVMNIGVLFSYFSRLFLTRCQADQSELALARALKIAPFIARETAAAAKRFSPEQLMAIIGHLRIADLRSKGIEGGSASEEEIMRELIFRIMH